MTRENIIAMLPPGKALEDCEGSCLVETGKNISADYVAQARVGKFGSQYTITMELYETAANNLVGSFTARKPDADGLLDEIEKKSEEIFRLILKTNLMDTKDEDVGISNIKTTSTGYRANYKVYIESNPTGAELTIDGHVNEKCNKTPCKVSLSSGTHRFAFVQDNYARLDSIIEIKHDDQLLRITLNPNFGTLILQPKFIDQMGSIESSDIEINEKPVQGEKQILSPGTHKVTISHPCYENITFDAKIGRGSVIKFANEIQPIFGGINLKIMTGNQESNEEIYVNEKLMGTAPLTMTIPICAKIAIGKKKHFVIPVKLKAGNTVDFTYKRANYFKDPRDGQSYKIIYLDDKIWMAENLNYKSDDSWCYRNKATACKTYGRLYTWESALKICPTGWHLPSVEEYKESFDYASSKLLIGKKIKSKKGWAGSGNGDDFWGLKVLPAGGGIYGTNYNNAGNESYFWTSDQDRIDEPYAVFITYNDDEAYFESYDKYNGFSVRCVSDEQSLTSATSTDL